MHTGPFFASFFIGIIPGLVAEFCIHSAVDKGGFIVFRCTLEESQVDRRLEVPAWMFDRTACLTPTCRHLNRMSASRHLWCSLRCTVSTTRHI